LIPESSDPIFAPRSLKLSLSRKAEGLALRSLGNRSEPRSGKVLNPVVPFVISSAVEKDKGGKKMSRDQEPHFTVKWTHLIRTSDGVFLYPISPSESGYNLAEASAKAGSHRHSLGDGG
jgi:hypothetical protein